MPPIRGDRAGAEHDVGSGLRRRSACSIGEPGPCEVPRTVSSRISHSYGGYQYLPRSSALVHNSNRGRELAWLRFPIIRSSCYQASRGPS